LLPIGVKKYWEPKSFCYVKKEDSKVLEKSKDQKNDEKTKENSIHAKNEDWILYTTEHILTVSGAEVSIFRKNIIVKKLRIIFKKRVLDLFYFLKRKFNYLYFRNR
jgi:hypothetical protein